jgi:pimeloyl-ACP methyl ester carboxylesterase
VKEAGAMNGLKTVSLRDGAFEVKYYQGGRGPHLVFLHGAGGLPAFTSDLEALSAHFRVTAPLHPGFGTTGEETLHEDVLKLVLHTWDVLDALHIEDPILAGHSFGGMIAAEMAAIEPRRVKKLVLISPAGLYLDDNPTADFFAMTPEEMIVRAFHDPSSDAARTYIALPDDIHSRAEVMVQRMKGFAAAARFMWPLGDRGLSERLYRVKARTMLLWGESDRLIPPVYADAFKKLMTGAKSVRIEKIHGAGHMVLLERTDAAVKAITRFCSE